MARRKPAKAAKKPTRDTRARSRKAAPAAQDVEIVEEEKGMGIGDGITIATTLLLIAAILLTDYLLGAHYGGGAFFGG